MRAVSCQALEQIAWMCGDRERSQEIRTLRHLKVKTHSKIELFRNRGKESKEDLFLEIIMYLVFFSLTER